MLGEFAGNGVDANILPAKAAADSTVNPGNTMVGINSGPAVCVAIVVTSAEAVSTFDADVSAMWGMYVVPASLRCNSAATGFPSAFAEAVTFATTAPLTYCRLIDPPDVVF